MTPHKKLNIANVLMLFGIVVIIYGFSRLMTVLTPVPVRMSEVGEGLLSFGIYVVPALIAGLLGFVWSLIVEKRNPSARVPGTYALRIVVVVTLLVPIAISVFRLSTD